MTDKLYYCAGGRIPSTVKMATIWLIPKDVEKPVNGRTKEVIANRSGK